MDRAETALLVEVHVTTDDGRHESFTAYPVAPECVLTARHGLLPSVAKDKKRIVVRWHHQPAAKREWRPAKIRPR